MKMLCKLEFSIPNIYASAKKSNFEIVLSRKPNGIEVDWLARLIVPWSHFYPRFVGGDYKGKKDCVPFNDKILTKWSRMQRFRVDENGLD